MTNAKGHQTELTWEPTTTSAGWEDDGAVTLGVRRQDRVPLEMRDPEANKNNNGRAALRYRFGLNGHTAELPARPLRRARASTSSATTTTAT